MEEESVREGDAVYIKINIYIYTYTYVYMYIYISDSDARLCWDFGLTRVGLTRNKKERVRGLTPYFLFI